MYDLLNEQLIGVRTVSGDKRVNLPELLAALSDGQIDGFTGLRAHQADPWHVFLVQLAASIQARHPTETLSTDPQYWRDGLLDLADGMESAWHLVVEDVAKPACFQHPWAPGDEKDYKREVTRPDELDVLVTAKNHDVKMARMAPNLAESWLYALLVLQTTSGFLGQGNYGIVRMNGGFASRPVVSWAESLNPSQRFIDDVEALRGLRRKICEQFRYRSKGVVLTWLHCWQRENHQYLTTQLEPWFIEAARPIRLRALAEGAIFALAATSKVRQIGPKTLENGDVGDPWIPLKVADKRKGRSALTLTAEGFSPQRVTDLLFENGFELTELQKPKTGEGAGYFIGSCLVRGQGTTGGFHRLELLVPAKARLALLSDTPRKALAELAQDLLQDARDIQKALSLALVVLSEGGPEQADFHRDAVKTWMGKTTNDFTRGWEVRYFPMLWRGADETQEFGKTVRQEWQQTLANLAQSLLNDATTRLPLPTNRTWRALMKAQSAFLRSLRKSGLPLPSRSTHHPTEEEITP